MKEEKSGLQHPQSRDLLASRAVLNLWVAIPAGVTYQVFYMSGIYIHKIHNSDGIMEIK